MVKAKVFHEGEEAKQDPSAAGAGTGAGTMGSKLAMMTNWAAGRKGSKPAAVTTRLVLWDMRDGKQMSAPAVKTGEWEVGRKYPPGSGIGELKHRRNDFVSRETLSVYLWGGIVKQNGQVDNCPRRKQFLKNIDCI